MQANMHVVYGITWSEELGSPMQFLGVWLDVLAGYSLLESATTRTRNVVSISLTVPIMRDGYGWRSINPFAT